MADRLTAELWIGGKVPVATAGDLCRVITQADVYTEWDAGLFRPETAEELLNAREERDGQLILYLCDHQAPWGTFPALEEWLQSRRIAYTRHCSGNEMHQGEVLYFRPGSGAIRSLVDRSWQPVAPIGALREVLELLNKATSQKLQHEDLVTLVRTAQQHLAALLPADVPPLPEFQIG